MAGRVLANNLIVPLHEVMDLAGIREERVNLSELPLNDPLTLIKWPVRRGLLRNSVSCEACHIPMSFCQRQRLRYGYTWTCRICANNISIRRDSFFANSRLTLRQIVVVLYGWCKDFTQKQICEEARVPDRSHTILDWCNFCREIFGEHLRLNPLVEIIGGLNDDGTTKVVEIDESKFFHRKYNRGQWREGHWAFGGIERGTGKCFLIEVPDRTEQTLFAAIRQHILPGSIIVSDGWRAYRNVNLIDGGVYEHQVIIHERNFVDPNYRYVHTQNVENMWMRAKRKLRRQFGTSRNLFDTYMQEFLWRNVHKNSNIFREFLICLSLQYPH